MLFRELLGRAMGLQGLKSKELAHKSGVSQRYINALLKGERNSPTIRVAAALARALSVSLDWLAGMPKQNPGQLDPDEAELLKLYRSLPDYEKPAILGSVRLHAEVTRRKK